MRLLRHFDRCANAFPEKKKGLRGDGDERRKRRTTGGVERNKFCTDGRMALGGREKKIAAGLEGDTFSERLFPAALALQAWAALLCLPRQQSATARGSLRQSVRLLGAVPAA